jgi:gamma-glutamyl:cysteine ligase YbdK (ATP-grasp superfamily)
MADLSSGRREPTAQRLTRLLEALGDAARRVGCGAALDGARTMLDAGGPAAAQRRVAARGGPRAVVAWLAERYDVGL